MTDVPAPRRAKLELLVRGEDDESFEIKEIGSGFAFLQSRPQRVSAASYELAEVPSRISAQQSYVLKNTATERFLLLSEPERFLWDQMDGRVSLQDIATAYVLKYGEFDFEIIPNLIRKLQRAGLLTFTTSSRLRQALARNRSRRVVNALESGLLSLERINISSRRAHAVFARIYRWGGFLLFTPAAILACAALAVVGLAAGVRLWPHAHEVVAGFGGHPILAILAVKLVFLLTVGVHQVVHALACIHYRRRVREFGFTFQHGFLPTFFVDVTDIFMANRRARVITALCGPIVHLVLGSLCFLLATRLPGGFLQAFAAASGIVQWQAFVVTLYPFCFLEMDGYHILVDALGVPSLKQDALGYVGALFRGGGRRRFSREVGLWLGYVGLSIVSVAAFIAFNVYLVMHST